MPYKGAGDSLGVRATPGEVCSEWTQGGELSPGRTLLKVGDDMRPLCVSDCGWQRSGADCAGPGAELGCGLLRCKSERV
jgi:hypothetical protein